MNNHINRNAPDAPVSSIAHSTAKIASLRKLSRWIGSHKWLLTALIWIVAFVLGIWGLKDYYEASGQKMSIWEILYGTLQLFNLRFPFPENSVSNLIGWQLQTARLLAPIIALFTALQALTLVIDDQYQMFRTKFLRNHVVICGLGRKGLILAQGFCEKGENVLVIEQDEKNGFIGGCRDYGAIVLIGNASDLAVLRKSRVHNAKYVISVCGDDGVNAEVAVHSRGLASQRKGMALECVIHIVDLQLCNLLREKELAMSDHKSFHLELFNVFETGARVMLDRPPPFDSSRAVSSESHICVIGIGRFGESVVVNSARNWWNSDNKAARLRITMVDRNATSKKESLSFRYPNMTDVCDLVPKDMDFSSTEFERAGFLLDQDGHSHVSTIYVCLDHDSSALAVALKLYYRTREAGVRIVVRLSQEAGLATLLQGEYRGADTFHDVKGFGLFDSTCIPDVVLRGTYEILGRTIHENYLRHNRASATPEKQRSKKNWEELDQDLIDSNIEQALQITDKLKAINCWFKLTTDWDISKMVQFSDTEVEELAKMEHLRWCAEKKRRGWKFGEPRDDNNKIHDCLKDWDLLDENVKNKDRNPVREIPETLGQAGFEVYRLKRDC
ncbi:MAG: NAD-binding protein [Dehalococcoidia bacterium]